MNKVSKEKLPVTCYLGSITIGNITANSADELIDTLVDELRPIVSKEQCHQYHLKFEWANDETELAYFSLSGQRLETDEEVYARRKTILEQKKMAARARLKNIKNVEAKEKAELARLQAKYGAK
jgi:putative cell wall-binding protein